MEVLYFFIKMIKNIEINLYSVMKNRPPIQSDDIENLKKKVSFGLKIWLEFENGERKNILGSGWAKLLNRINELSVVEDNSLTKAAQDCGYSYKYAWNILKRIEKRTGKAPVDTGKGGSGGGGWIRLNEWGQFLLETYNALFSEIKKLEKKLESTLRLD
jgi:molybdate transport repressor ModE-like protein